MSVQFPPASFDSCLVGTSILSILFTLSDISRFPVWMRDQVSYPYETTGETEGKGKIYEVALCLATRHEGAYVRQWKYTAVRS